MNKNLYRIVFNKARGMLVVVAEITRSCRAVACPASGSASVQRQCITRLNALAFGLLLALGAVQPATANVVADKSAPGSQQPTIISSANGTPQVNIQTPSQGGVSRNVYSQFDVNNKGVILNNSRTHASTQIGGMVASNPWLSRGEAKIILNEVNSRNPSQLNGYIEVAGKKAQVVIANPSGITCDGCGFINANRATLTTGQAQLNNGNLTGYDVSKGDIVIQGKGMDTSRQDYTDIIARSVKVNAGLWANDLKVTAGASTVDAAHEKVVAKNGDAATRPQLAVDVASLGGMYAGKIRLTGSEAGVGVRNAGNIGAQAGTVVVTADGQIDNSGNLNSAGDMRLTAGSVRNSGKIYAGGSAEVNSRGEIEHSGTLATADNLTLRGNRITATAQSTVAAGIDKDGQAGEHGNVTLSSHGRLTLQGQNIAGGTLTANAQGIDASGSRTATGNTALDAGHGDLDLRLASVDATGKLEARSTGRLLNDGGTLSGKNVDLNSRSITNREGNLVAGQRMDITADTVSGDGKILSEGDLNLSLQQGLTNQSLLLANGDLTLTSGGTVDNQGKLLAGKTLTLQAASATNARDAELGGGESHLLLSDSLVNRGLIDGTLTHIDTGTLTNLGAGRIYGDHIAIKANTLDNGAENGVAATLAARDRLDIAAGALNNTGHGLIYSAGAMGIGGSLDTNLNATGRGGVLTNRGASIESGGDMRLDMETIHNLNNHLVTNVVVTGTSRHHEAVLSGKTQRYDWSQVNTSQKNKYGVHSAKMPDGSSSDKFYEYNYTRTVQETRVIESDPGKILSGGNLTINSDQMNNLDSQVIAAKVLGGVISLLNNDATSGVKIITDIGSQTRWYAKKKKKKLGGTKTSQGKDTNSYRPSPVTQAISLSTMAWEDNNPAQGGSDRPVALPAGQTWESAKNSSGEVVRTGVGDTRVPSGSLYTVHASTTSHYLVETDPRFTQERTWLGSDYMQNALSPNGDTILKRLGDGFYEQQLIRNQVTSLTGQRYLSGFDDDNAQYKALMDAGVAFTREHNLTTGVALSAEQMALLTSDMVWMVEQTVQLPDGSSQRVLVPQVYVRVKEGDVDGNGSLMAGNRVALQTADDLNNSGTLAGREITAIAANNVTNSGLIRGGTIDIATLTDFNNVGGTLLADDALQVTAGRNLNSTSTLSGDDSNRSLDRTAGIYVQNDSGKLVLQGVNDINLNATLVGNNGKESTTVLSAGHNINLGTIATTHSERGDWGGDNYRDLTQRSDVGSQIAGNGSVQLSAGNDLNALAASINATDALSAVAGNDMNIVAGESAYHLTEHSRQTSKGFLSGRSLETHDEIEATQATASNVTGDSVTLLAGNNLTVRGSNVAGENDVRLAAGNNLTLDTAEEQRQENHLIKESKSGLMGTGGIGFSYGRQSVKTTDDGNSTAHAISTVGSSAGSLSLEAGNDLSARSAELIAAKEMSLAGKNVAITAASDSSAQTHRVEQKQSGFTLALSGAVGSALNTAVETANQAQETEDSRIAALQQTKAALSGVQAAQAASLASAQSGTPGASDNTVGISLSYGSQSSTSTQHSEQVTARGGSLTAGDNVKITANGSGNKGTDGDILLQGTTVQAGKNIDLTANRDITLTSAQNTSLLTGSNKSSGGSVGVGIGVGSGGFGISVSASLNKGKGHESGNGTTHTETLLNAGQAVNLVSGRDTTLTGAQVSGETVRADVARNLTMTSEQDSDRYDSKQQNASVGGSFTFGSMTGSASVNLSRDKMHSNYDSVVEQTGIFAGKGGFDVTVGEHTQLNGAVIGSTATADNNKLDTGTLGFSDIHNRADYKVEHQSIGLSTGGSIGGQAIGNMANTLLAGVNKDGHDSGTTKAAVSDGTLVIRDQDKQAQDVANLSRDAQNANGSISQIFDKEKEQKRIQQAQLIGEISTQVSDIVRTQGAISAAKDAREKMGSISQEDRDRAQKDWVKAHPGQTPDENAINGQVYQNFYDQAFNATGLGTGGAVQQGIQAATAVVQGLAGGDITSAIAGGMAPYLAEQIHKRAPDEASRVMAHAVVAGVLAEVQGRNAAGAAAGAATAAIGTSAIAKAMYGTDDFNNLGETQKQTVSALATLASGLAGGLAGDSSTSALAGAQAGKNTAENNEMFSLPKGMTDYSQGASTLGMSMIDAGVTTEEVNAALSKNVKGDLPDGANITKAIVEGYTDIALVAGAAYLGPAASAGKVVGGAIISEIANGSYQWFDLSQPGNEKKTWDYKGSISAGITGALAPGRGVWQNAGISAGGTLFTDGLDKGALTGTASSWAVGSVVSAIAPPILDPVLGPGSGFVSEVIGSVGGEFIGNQVKDKINEKDTNNVIK
ncbi:hemagglutinin repeat-containing protein [Erwinia sp. MYb535]|uniref:hemagglutinin repeat-containing protein n=2 Tax=unclassified Erwinia TaxID=2622719 RepID=UPI0030984A69